MPDQELFVIADAAKILGLTETAPCRKIDRREIPIQKFGYRTVIARSTIDAIRAGKFAAPSSK